MKCFIAFSLNTDNSIDTEGVVILSEALQSNSSLASLNLSGMLVVSLISHLYRDHY
jgi:hypothetical protein